MTDKAIKPLRQRLKVPLAIYFITLFAYMGAAGSRLKRHSNDNHYVYLAQNILNGRLSLKGTPPHQNDWARVYDLELKDGRKVRGTFLKTGRSHVFRTTDGEELYLPPKEIKSRKQTYYVSFPWFPAILMLPFVAIWGLNFNDVIFNILFGALNPVLLFILLERLRKRGYSTREKSENLWLTAMFAFGSVHFFSAVIGQVWFTAHIVGVTLSALYALAALEGKHLYLAGLLLGFGFITRPPIFLSFPFVLAEILRQHVANKNEQADDDSLIEKARAYWRALDKKHILRDLIKLASPSLLIGIIAMILNKRRFDRISEFGHTYLNVKWAERIQRWGLFNYHFISRNLTVMLTLLPRLVAKYPYIKISFHGIALPFTTPYFLYVFWPKARSVLAKGLIFSILLPMTMHLLYQNSGWVQFGYRFSLDYTIYLIALLAVSGRPLKHFAKGLIIWGIIVNTFGAITFGRMWQFYWDGIFPTK